jgi:hypothetical protein
MSLDSVLISVQKRTASFGFGKTRHRLSAARDVAMVMGKVVMPLQLGVGVSAGAEALMHAMRTHLDADPLRP